MGEGRGASKEHMEQYKLFGAPRKTGKIIISVPETAHFCLQLYGTQTLHGQCLVPQTPTNTMDGARPQRAGLLHLEQEGKENLLVILAPATSPTWDSYGLLGW